MELLNTFWAAPILVISFVCSLIAFFKIKDLILVFIEQRRIKKIESMTISQCENCKNFEEWQEGDKVYYQIDQTEAGVGILISFHPYKVILNSSSGKTILVPPGLIAENETAKIRINKRKAKNFLDALHGETVGNKFLLTENTERRNYEKFNRT